MPRCARPGAHDALLEAARDEFARRGLERARVEDISRRARLSKGAFYLHFRTKEDAFREILQRFLGAIEEQAERRNDAEARFLRETAGAPPDLARRLEFECAFDTEVLELLWRNRRIVAAMDGAGGHRYARLVADFRERMRAVVARNIASSQLAGQLRPDADPAVLGDVIVGAFEAYARRLVPVKEKPDLAAWARSFLLVLYLGMLDRAPAPSEPRRLLPTDPDPLVKRAARSRR